MGKTSLGFLAFVGFVIGIVATLVIALTISLLSSRFGQRRRGGFGDRKDEDRGSKEDLMRSSSDGSPIMRNRRVRARPLSGHT